MKSKDNEMILLGGTSKPGRGEILEVVGKDFKLEEK